MKSQISIEFLVGVVIILFIYTITISAFGSYTQNTMLTSEVGRQVCYMITTGIDAAVIGGNNFAINVSIPYFIENKDYSILINETNSALVTIDWGDGLFACSTTTQNITSLLFTPCKFSINNLNGKLYLSTITTEKTKYNLGEQINISGAYYISNVSLKILDSADVVVDNNILPLTNNKFNYSWTPTSSGAYKIIVYDNTYKTLNSEKEIYVI